jgi:hypothetical protein
MFKVQCSKFNVQGANKQPRSKLGGIGGKGFSTAENVGWVEAHSAETHRFGFASQQAAGN